jgi:hypothetical protein
VDFNNFRPTGPRFVLLQVVLFGAAGILAAGIFLHLTAFIVGAIALTLAAAGVFAVGTMRRIAASMPVGTPRSDPC